VIEGVAAELKVVGEAGESVGGVGGEELAEMFAAGTRGAGVGDTEALGVVGEDGDEIGAFLGARGDPLRIEESQEQEADAGGAKGEADGEIAASRRGRAEGEPGEGNEDDRGEEGEPGPSGVGEGEGG